jgi:hypothetical protein
VEEEAGGGLEDTGDAVVAPAQLVVAAENVFVETVLNKAAQKKIELELAS